MFDLNTKKGRYLYQMMQESSDVMPSLFERSLLGFNIAINSIEIRALVDLLESSQVIPAGAFQVNFNIQLDLLISDLENIVMNIDNLMKRDKADRTGPGGKKP